ncbi:MAG: anti-sigma factor domain-containing protein [Alicyclobacillus sp.]|nr:anti-sigma factor domain-containing protein [Alicyclobacillus sp.]
MRRTGIVLEVGTDYAIVLSRDGEFCRIPKAAAMDVGSEVEWDAAQLAGDAVAGARRTRPGGRAWWRWALATGAACVSMGAALWFGQTALRPQTAEAYAFVSVDANPGVSLEVDGQLRVVRAVANDAQGSALLAQLQLQGLSLEQAVADWVRAAQQKTGQRDGIVVASAPGEDNSDVARVQAVASAGVKSAVQQTSGADAGYQPAVYTLVLSPDVWQAAKQAHVSPGKLAVYLVAADEGVAPAAAVALNRNALQQVLDNPAASGVLSALRAADSHALDQLLDHLSALSAGSAADGTDAANGQAPGQGAAAGAGAGRDHPGVKADAGAGNRDNGGGPAQAGKGSGAVRDGAASAAGNGQTETGRSRGNNGPIRVQLGHRVLLLPSWVSTDSPFAANTGHAADNGLTSAGAGSVARDSAGPAEGMDRQADTQGAGDGGAASSASTRVHSPAVAGHASGANDQVGRGTAASDAHRASDRSEDGRNNREHGHGAG